MIKGIGVDIIEVGRIRRLLERDRRFVDRIFTATEIRYCAGKFYPEQHFAARFTAKEAFMKAMGTGWEPAMGWKDVAVENDPQGKPQLRLSRRLRERFSRLGLTDIHLSLSHTREHAVAMVVLE